MIRYILECMAFQLLFLIVYDLFLKRETFFQWNRAYLIGTFVLSLLLPWIKIEAFKTTVSSEYFIYPEYLWGMDMSEGVVVAPENYPSFDLSASETIFYGGMLIAALLFAYKLFQINRLKRHGEICYFKDFTRVLVRNSNIAFSFFRSIFLGDQVLEKEHQSIIQHELVHIEQRHTWDLLFFESMRILGWFNPLVYVYQNRVSELHEFIADAKVAKTHKAEQYQLLLSQVFQTQHISFINQFFKTSLVKKRIVMLQKSKSKKVWRLKYLLIIPIILGMLVYTSCENDMAPTVSNNVMIVDDISTMSESDNNKLYDVLKELSDRGEYWEFLLKDQDSKIHYRKSTNGSYIKFDGKEDVVYGTMVIEGPTVGDVSGKDVNGEVQIRIKDKNSVKYVLAKDGSVSSIEIGGPDKILTNELNRIVEFLPKKIPGKQMGDNFAIPIKVQEH
ncbi:M56 family metallopeptidase [Arenibacter palladensis]|uniref:M56 family metallopeptidase n=1 Tax=Arenibacter palladensis TaxID=237373 RepID=UPI0026E2F7DA|nr:M56 family metallopeptidase [Arenibacter palladensis]MDO6603717.1 M56 family metallopeptidase [Arenibacter palladensis]